MAPRIEQRCTTPVPSTPLREESQVAPTISPKSSKSKSSSNQVNRDITSPYGDKAVGTYKSNGCANGRYVFLGPRGGLYYLSCSKSRAYVTSRPTQIEYFIDSPKKDEDNRVGTYISNGSANGRPVYKGPRGGLYYLTSSGTKTYVNSSNIKMEPSKAKLSLFARKLNFEN